MIIECFSIKMICMQRTFYAVVLLFFIFDVAVQAQDTRVYSSTRLSGAAPVIDGHLNEEVWQQANWQNNFVQFQPSNGKPPHQKTEFAIVYDDNNLYVAIKALDSSPDSIQRRLTVKDQMEGDLAGVAFDSYHDKRTAFVFVVSAGGVKSDFILSNDGENTDNTWDPIWYVKTSITAEGWVAEMRIPLSQLRFEKNGEQHWGLQVLRNIDRYQEMSFWQPIPKESSGLVHLFGELNGIAGISPRRQVELAPYLVGRLERYEKEAGNPFSPGKGSDAKAGIDGKIGITNNIIMDFTINPDFGQVEADPSQLNLTAYETYYKEQRPFFIEGKSIYSFPLMIGDGDMSGENLFYSRRIGRSPQYIIDAGNNEYVKAPSNTNILGAAKISGKTKDGLSIGLLESVTSNEYAEIDSLGHRRKIMVEPLTNYFVSRIQKDFNKGNSILGAIFTATNRDIASSSVNFLLRSAYTGGVDFTQYWKNRNYYFTLKGIFSEVNGSEEALVNLQEASSRYFQRPDISYVRLDSARRSLSGYGGRIEIGKTGGSKWTYGLFANWKSPGLELNDLGYERDADMVLQILWSSYQMLQPKGILREFRLFLDQFSAWDFGGLNLAKGLEGNTNMQFTNYWRFNFGFNLEGNNFSKSMLRGGSDLKMPGGIRNYMSVSTDDRKKLVVMVDGFQYYGQHKFDRQHMIEANLQYRPFNIFQISLAPQYMVERNEFQYVDTYSDHNQNQYLFGLIDQRVMSMSVRMNLTLLPNLNIQYWGQPFVASGKYSNYKIITSPRASDYYARFHQFAPAEISYSPDLNEYQIDQDQNHIPEYTFSNPDFNWKEFRSNLVLKWEYIPGSDLYLVWSQSRDNTDSFGTFSPSRDLHNLFNLKPYNIFLIKVSYRFRM